MRKCIYVHKLGDNLQITHAFIIGGFDDKLIDYLDLVDVASKDFPNLLVSSTDVSLHKLFHSREIMIRFVVPKGTTHPEYYMETDIETLRA